VARVFRLFKWLSIPVGVLSIGLGLRARSWIIKIPAILSGSLLGFLGGLVAYWSLRPNRAWRNPTLSIKSWVVVNDGQHNSNTDMIDWQGYYYLVYAASPYHLASAESHLVILRSRDALRWERVARLDAAPEDIRDPKFAAIGGQLFLYALKNVEVNPEPYTTVYSRSADGVNWDAFQAIEQSGWLFWRPKSRDQLTWYVPAYWWEHGRSALFRSEDGIHWTQVSEIYRGGRNDETDIEFLPDGRMIATARLEYGESPFGHPQGSTLVTVSDAGYQSWQARVESKLTRLDGPNLFSWHGRVYAVGRYQPEVHGPFGWQGSAFVRKRTALFAVDENGLRRLTDLPSSGDTSYAGVVVKEDALYSCYYSSDIRKDPVWIIGMLEPSSILMARLSLPELVAAAEREHLI
jgi:hypothetical protein